MNRIERVPISTSSGIDTGGAITAGRIAKVVLLFAALVVPAATWGQSPTITSMSPSSGPVGMAVTLTGSNFGPTQGSSTVSLNSTAAVITSWSSTSIVAVVPAGASSGSFAVTVNSQTANSSTFAITSLPSGWSNADVGSVGIAGSVTYANGTFTVKGSGAQVWGTADGLQFAYQSLSGDGTIIARVVSLTGGSSSQSAGVMIRETLNAGSTNAYGTYTASSIYFDERTSTGGTTSTQGSAGVNLPYWVKLVRSGSTFSGYASYDAVNWTQLGTSQTISMVQNVYIGLAVNSSSNSSLATATFDNVSISSAASPAPAITNVSATTGSVGSQIVISGSNFGASEGSSVVTLSGTPVPINSWSNTSITITIPSAATSGPLLVAVGPGMNDSNYVVFTITSQPLPGTWLDDDVGQVGIAGSATYTNGVFTVKGSGAQVWGTADGMHFAYQSLSGDGTIIARVVSLTGGSTGQSAGVMVRETLNANSANVYTAYCPPNICFDERASTGASTSSQTLSVVSLPYWVKLVRSGSTFSGYASYDGFNWAQVGTNQTVSMAQNVYIGLAVNSSSNSSLATATFDNVSISSAASPAPVITSVSATTGPIGSQVVISGSNFGTTQGSSVVTLNGAQVTINSWSNTSITITIPSAATSGPLLVAVGPSMNSSNRVIFTVTSQPLPVTWLNQDVGQVGIAGSATYTNGVFTVKGSGAQVWGTADGMHFAYQSLSGDGTIIARVVSLTGGSTGQSAGVMVRETLYANSTNVYAAYCSGPAICFDERASTGASTSSQTLSVVSLPYWVKLVRSGSTFSGYASSDGVNWVQLGTNQTVSMAPNVYIGLAVDSSSNSSLAIATFDNVLVASSANPGTLVGMVTRSSDGSIVSGAQVQATQGGSVKATVTSDLNGNYTVFNLTAGPCDVKVSATGLGTASQNDVFIRANQVTTLNVSLSSPGTISGTITRADGITPISGASISASVGTLIAASATSNSNGGYSIAGLNAGNYVVQASSSGFANASQPAAVTANSTTPANFSLQTQGTGAGSYVYDPLGRLVGVILQTGNTVIYNYDAVGNLLSITRQSSSQLAILTFSPARGPVGTTVTIYGTGFNSTPSQNTVSFNGTNATVQSATSTQLVVTVPSGITTGPISVTTSAGTVTSNSSFTVGN